MIQEDDKYLQHAMEGASLKELFPEFDKEAEWMKMSAKMTRRSVPVYSWMKVAAILLVVAVCGGAYWLFTNNSKPADVNNVAVTVPVAKAQQPAAATTAERPGQDDAAKPMAINAGPAGNKKIMVVNSRPSQKIVANALATGTYGKSTEAICNATKCALEICISQTVKCKDKAPAEVADCRTLEPDQAGPLKYTDPERYGCKVTVDEIRIKKVSTGETIVINSDTQPASAEEMLQCFTGERKCGIMAGFFDADCDNSLAPRKITVDSHYGDVTIQ